MDRPSAAPASLPPGAPVALESLVEDLAAEMAAAWQRGERPGAEAFLARHPEIAACPEAAVRLVYEEVCLREEHGSAVPASEVVRRFPQWASQLEILLDCHGLMRPPPPAVFPEAGEHLGDFRLLAELGRGALGRVFLAAQPSLADRTLVLKVTPREGTEHLNLARLQHTHVVPLYVVQDFPDRHLRVMCMPYLGGATLARVQERLQGCPPGERGIGSLLRALDEAQSAAPPAGMERGPARAFLGRASQVQALCWLGACLAEALHYAHERGLVHLDVKPSNVLVAADGQPMLLDFHLARGRIRAGETTPEWLGGTRGYMSPEQQAALAAVRAGRPVPADVDGRSDVYSLGLLLYEALGGPRPSSAEEPLPRLCRCNRQVSVGLSDVIHKCLAADPRRRYPDAGALAEDLRRHRNDLPLMGVRNRSLRERWRKWRRRRPHALALVGLRLLVPAVLLGAAAVGLAYREQRAGEARAMLAEGEQRLRGREYPEAVRTLTRGLEIAGGFSGGDELARTLDARLALAKRGRAAGDLHRLAERVRFLLVDDPLPPASLRLLDRQCSQVWEHRQVLVERLGTELDPDMEESIAEDLLDLVLFWSDVRLRLAPDGQATAVQQEIAGLLAEAKALGGPSPIPARERYVRGRSLLREGRLAEAAAELEQAVRLQPQGFWPNFYQGACAYRRQQYADAVNCFRVCVSLAPERAECYCNRGLAWDGQGKTIPALADYDRALELDPTLAAAALNRGVLHYREKRYDRAEADLRRAVEHGANPAAVHYNLALVHWARNDRPAALASVKQALAHDPAHARARELQARLQGPR